MLSVAVIKKYSVEIHNCKQSLTTSISRFFLRKIEENTKIFRSYCKSDADVAETHFLVHYRQFQLVCCQSYTRSRCSFTPNRWARSLQVTWQRWRSHHSIRHRRKPPRKLHGFFFYRTWVIANWSFTLREYGISRIFAKNSAKYLNFLFAPRKGRRFRGITSFEP